MAYSLSNKCAKNLCKRTVLVQLIVETMVTCFFGTQCSFSIANGMKIGGGGMKQEGQLSQRDCATLVSLNIC